MRFSTLTYALALCLTAPVSTLAQTPPSVEAEQRRAALIKAVDDFEGAMRTKSYDQVVFLSVPPKMMLVMAKDAGLGAGMTDQAIVEKLRGVTSEQTREAMKSVTLVSHKLDTGAVRFVDAPGGQPYAFIPSETVFRIPGAGDVRTQSQTLAIWDDARWYLVRAGENEIPRIRKAYPQFANVKFESAVTTRVGQ